MNRRDDISYYYNISNKFSLIGTILFFSNIVLSLLIILLDKFNIVITILMLLSIIVSFSYPVIEIIDDNLFWYKAESLRRQSCIKEGFDTDIINETVEGYYNNSISPSYNKYAINSFENIFFSKNIASKMLIASAIKSAICIILFIIMCITIKNRDILLLISQSLFSTTYICGTISLFTYKYRLDKLYEKFYENFITIGITTNEQRILLLANIVEYESVKAHYKIRLSTRVFNSQNLQLSTKWNQIVQKCKFN